jgi:hypothetical protein
MAARRLLIVMLILLGLSTLAAALVPPRTLRGGGTTGATTTQRTVTAPPAVPPGGQDVPVKFTVGGKTVPVVACRSSTNKRQCAPILVGDQLSLIIHSRVADELEIPAFGLVKAVDPEAPAFFDLLPETPGTYAINFASNEQLAAQIKVMARGAARKAKGSKRSARGG